MKYITLIVIASLLLVQLAAAVKQVIDVDSSTVINANDLCQHTGKRISRITTIRQLVGQFDSLEDTVCREQWIQPLHDLQLVLDAVEHDACSKVAVDRIDFFHWTYIVRTLSRSWRHASATTIPEPLRVFFMNLADEVAERCKAHLADRLNETATTSDVESKSLSDGSFGFMVNTLTVGLIPKTSVKKFDDFFLVINSLVDLDRRKGRNFTTEIDPVTGEVVSMSIKVKDASNAQFIQHKCRHELRPVYTNTVLPVMQLIDMGYGTKGDRIGDNDQIKNWYGITQLCELVVPIRFYTVDTLKNGQIAFVNKEDASKLQGSPDAVQVQNLPAPVEVSPIELADMLTTASSDAVVKKVKSNFRARGKIYQKTFKNVFSTIKSEMVSTAKSVFKTKRKHNKIVLTKEDAEKVEATINDATRIVKEGENDDETEEQGLVRHKRGFTYFVKWGKKDAQDKKKCKYCKLVACAIIAFAICLVITGIFFGSMI